MGGKNNKHTRKALQDKAKGPSGSITFHTKIHNLPLGSPKQEREAAFSPIIAPLQLVFRGILLLKRVVALSHLDQ